MSKLTKSKGQPWHKLPEEGFKAHELLMTYIGLGAGRTVKKVSELAGRSASLCNELSAKFHWPDRAGQYDQWMLTVQENAIEAELGKDAIAYAQKRSRYRVREHTLAQRLLDQAMDMLATPLFEETITKSITIHTVDHPEGEEIVTQVVRIPVKWNKRDAVAYAKVAVEIMRLHLEMETSRMAVNVDLTDPKVRLGMARASLEKWRKNVDQLVDEELARNPNLDRGLVTIAILEKLPEWAARDWKLLPNEIPLLTEGDDALPLSINDVSVPGTYDGQH